MKIKSWSVMVTTLALGLAGCKHAETKPVAPMPVGSPMAGSERPGALAIIPATTSIEFTGSTTLQSHPGHFEAFDGAIELQGDDPRTAKLHVIIDMNSTTTKIPLLTKHLKAEDFFDVAHHPTSEFTSTGINPTGEAGVYQIDGTLTLHGISRPIAFPAKIAVSPDQLTLDGTMVVRQTEFGMTESARKTKDEVPIRISIRSNRR